MYHPNSIIGGVTIYELHHIVSSIRLRLSSLGQKYGLSACHIVIVTQQAQHSSCNLQDSDLKTQLSNQTELKLVASISTL